MEKVSAMTSNDYSNIGDIDATSKAKILIIDSAPVYAVGVEAVLERVGHIVDVSFYPDIGLVSPAVWTDASIVFLEVIASKAGSILPALRWVLEKHPSVKVILTTSETTSFQFSRKVSYLSGNASVYSLSKSASTSALLEVYRAATLNIPAAVTAESGLFLSTLTEKRRQVLRLTIDGLSTKQMAGVLGTSTNAIIGQLGHIYKALGVNCRRDAVIIGRALRDSGDL